MELASRVGRLPRLTPGAAELRVLQFPAEGAGGRWVSVDIFGTGEGARLETGVGTLYWEKSWQAGQT